MLVTSVNHFLLSPSPYTPDISLCDSSTASCHTISLSSSLVSVTVDIGVLASFLHLFLLKSSGTLVSLSSLLPWEFSLLVLIFCHQFLTNQSCLKLHLLFNLTRRCKFEDFGNPWFVHCGPLSPPTAGPETTGWRESSSGHPPLPLGSPPFL